MSATPHTRTSTRRRGAALLAATAAATTAVIVVLSSASAQTPAPRTLILHELDKGSTYTHVRNTRTASQQSNSQGDLIVFTNPVTDASGTRIGKLHAQCVTTVGARDFRKSTITCTAVVHLRDGNLMGQFIASPADTFTTGAITGGTGAYANARGAIGSKHTQAGSDDTITLTGEPNSPSSTKAQVIASRGGDPALPWAFGGPQVAQTTTPHIQRTGDGFDWGSAGIGATAASGLILVAVGAAYRARIRIAS
jgi:hypothetical protein